MSGRTRGEIHAPHDASREYTHRHGLPLDHAAVVSMLEKNEAISKIVLQPGASLDLLTTHESDLPTSSNVSDVEKSPHADMWRHSMH